jgi:hypothetical protein
MMTTSRIEQRRIARLSQHPGWVFDELSFVRREAQILAEQAYSHWLEYPTREWYAVFRAAQDRADAAQDALAALFDDAAEAA